MWTLHARHHIHAYTVHTQHNYNTPIHLYNYGKSATHMYYIHTEELALCLCLVPTFIVDIVRTTLEDEIMMYLASRPLMFSKHSLLIKSRLSPCGY